MCVRMCPLTLDLEKLMHRKLPDCPTLAFALFSLTAIACSDETPVSPTPSRAQGSWRRMVPPSKSGSDSGIAD